MPRGKRGPEFAHLGRRSDTNSRIFTEVDENPYMRVYKDDYDYSQRSSLDPATFRDASKPKTKKKVRKVY